MKTHSAEWYEAYRNRKISILGTSYPEPGETNLEPIEHWLALLIADHFYSVTRLEKMVSGCYAIRAIGGFVGIVTRVDGKPAILHKPGDGSRRLEILQCEFGKDSKETAGNLA